MPSRITENASVASMLELSVKKKKAIEYISCTDFIMLKKLGRFIFTSTTIFFVLPLFFSLLIYIKKLPLNL